MKKNIKINYYLYIFTKFNEMFNNENTQTPDNVKHDDNDPTLRYSHNLKVLLFDRETNNIVEDNVVLDSIKDALCKNNTHKVEWNKSLHNTTLKWEREKLTDIATYFIGDLFANPIYDYDSIIIQNTSRTINNNKLNCKYNIRFHISRMPGDKEAIKQYNIN